jgi:hypothetical protein
MVTKRVNNANVVLALGKDGIWSESMQEPFAGVGGYEESFGRLESFISASSGGDATTVNQFAESRIDDEGDKEFGMQLKMQRSGNLRPYLHFHVGDSVWIDLPPYLANPDRDLNLRQRIRGFTVDLSQEEMTFTTHVSRVIFEDELGALVAIAQLSERAPNDNSGVGTGSASSSGSVVRVSTGAAAVEDHVHKLTSSDISKKTASGDISGTLPGPMSVNAIRGLDHDVIIPAEPAGLEEVTWVYNYDTKQMELVVSGVQSSQVRTLLGPDVDDYWTIEETDAGDSFTVRQWDDSAAGFLDRIKLIGKGTAVTNEGDMVVYDLDGVEIFRWDESLDRIQFAAGKGKVDFAGGGSVLSSIERILSFAADINIEAESSGATSQSIKLWTDDSSGVSQLRIHIDGADDIILYMADGVEFARWDDGLGEFKYIKPVTIDTVSTTAAKPVLLLNQKDVDEDYFKFLGTSDTNVDRALVDAANFTTPGAIVGWLKVNVEDAQSTDPITDGDYYIPFYAVPTA